MRQALHLPSIPRRRSYLLWGLVVCVFVFALEVAVHVNHPAPFYSADTTSYVYAAEDILYHGRFVDFYRGPAYPTVMALTTLVLGDHSDFGLSAIHLVLYVIATLEIYAFLAIATRRPAVAGIVAIMAGMYFYPLAYDNLLIADSLAAFLLPTLALSVVLFLRYPCGRTLWLVTLICAILSLTLSEWFFFPIVLFAYLAWMAQRRGLLRALWIHLLTGLGGLLAFIGLYIEENGRQNGYYGISFIQNPDLLGKVLQYRMSGAGPGYAWLDQAVRQYETSPSGWEPFRFGYLHPEVSRDYWALGGEYARAVILHHPVQFVLDTIQLMLNPVASWSIEFVVPNQPYGRVLSTWEAISQQAYHVIVFAMLFALTWAVLLFVRPTARHLLTEAMGAIALMVCFEHCITTAAVYGEYERIQAPTAQLATVLTFGSVVLAVALAADLRANRRVLDDAEHEAAARASSESELTGSGSALGVGG